jgi:hypothetical protein
MARVVGVYRLGMAMRSKTPRRALAALRLQPSEIQ